MNTIRTTLNKFAKIRTILRRRQLKIIPIRVLLDLKNNGFINNNALT